MSPLDALVALGALREVDAALGRTLASRVSSQSAAVVGIAAATASAAVAQGHHCLPLAALDRCLADAAPPGAVLPELPPPAMVRSVLRDSPLVGCDDTVPVVLVLDLADRLYLRRYFRYERQLAAALRARFEPHPDVPSPEALRAMLDRLSAAGAMSGRQVAAVALALRNRFTLITGGPGTGKTTSVAWLLALLREHAATTGAAPPRVALAAPTGKAAARLGEALSRSTALPVEIATVHRLLGLAPERPVPRHHAGNPLPADIVIVDEASMLDLPLGAKLLDALTPSARLVLLGDRDQLASVEAGHVLGALAQAAGILNRYTPATAAWLQAATGGHFEKTANATSLADATVELEYSRRFAATSAIGALAAAVREGDVPAVFALLDTGDAVNRVAPELAALTDTLGRDVMPRYLPLLHATKPDAALALAERFRMLAALREGPWGARSLAQVLDTTLRERSLRRDGIWFVGRLVAIERNDTALELYNGDVGIALATGPRGALEVWFTGVAGPRAVVPGQLPAHAPAWALSVHKSQGSEWDDVLVVLPDRMARVLSRELVYTAITRARRSVSIWAPAEVLAGAIGRRTERWSGLSDALGAD